MKTELKVGLMAITAMLILLSMTFSVGKLNPFKQWGIKIPIVFNYVGNLKHDANARVSGVIIGRVSSVELIDDKVLVTIQLNSPDIKIKNNSQVFISSEGLIGESYIDIKVVKDDAPYYNYGDPPIAGTDPVGVGEIMSDTKSLTLKLQQTLDMVVSEKSKTNLDTVMTNLAESMISVNQLIKQNQSLINSIIENMNRMVLENRKNINTTSSNFNTLSGELSGMAQDSRKKVDNILNNLDSLSQSLDKKTVSLADELLILVRSINSTSGESNKKIADILANLDSVTQKLNKMSETFVSMSEKMDKGTGTLGKLINDPDLYENLNKTVEEARKITPELRTTLTSLRDITDKVNRGEGTLGQMVTDKNLYQNMNELVVNARSVVTRVSDLRTFWGYQLDYRYPNPKNSIKKDFKNTFIFRIDPSKGKYYKLELNDIGEKDKISVEVGETYFNNLILRAGVVESTGGIGLNYLLLNKRFSIGLTAFNFNEKTRPTLRFTNEVNLFENAYFTFGVDNFLNEERYYTGMKYLLEDKDIKYLLGLVSYAK